MSLDLILPVANELPTSFTLGRELTEEDALVLTQARAPKHASLKRITYRHKAMARAIAAGVPLPEVAMNFVISINTLYELMKNPAFKEMVEYHARVEESEMTIGEKLVMVGKQSLDRLGERLDDDEEAKKITIPQLLEIAKSASDRTGFGPASTNVSVNVNADLASRMKAARERAQQSIQSESAA